MNVTSPPESNHLRLRVRRKQLAVEQARGEVRRRVKTLGRLDKRRGAVIPLPFRGVRCYTAIIREQAEAGW